MSQIDTTLALFCSLEMVPGGTFVHSTVFYFSLLYEIIDGLHRFIGSTDMDEMNQRGDVDHKHDEGEQPPYPSQKTGRQRPGSEECVKTQPNLVNKTFHYQGTRVKRRFVDSKLYICYTNIF